LREQLYQVKEHEREAREEVLQLQNVIRKQRLVNMFKTVATKDKHQR
jgi:hypothetical protein